MSEAGEIWRDSFWLETRAYPRRSPFMARTVPHGQQGISDLDGQPRRPIGERPPDAVGDLSIRAADRRKRIHHRTRTHTQKRHVRKSVADLSHRCGGFLARLLRGHPPRAERSREHERPNETFAVPLDEASECAELCPHITDSVYGVSPIQTPRSQDVLAGTVYALVHRVREERSWA
jgi:hypothetical protein